jgi:hypothetical protein
MMMPGTIGLTQVPERQGRSDTAELLAKSEADAWLTRFGSPE